MLSQVRRVNLLTRTHFRTLRTTLLVDARAERGEAKNPAPSGTRSELVQMKSAKTNPISETTEHTKRHRRRGAHQRTPSETNPFGDLVLHSLLRGQVARCVMVSEAEPCAELPSSPSTSFPSVRMTPRTVRLNFPVQTSLSKTNPNVRRTMKPRLHSPMLDNSIELIVNVQGVLTHTVGAKRTSPRRGHFSLVHPFNTPILPELWKRI
jgi:hypothetical protein